MRAHNERLVLTLLRRHRALSKAELARRTGLSAQTMSVIMRGLERDGLLARDDPVRGKVGQPSVPMRLAPDGVLFYGLKIGRRSAELVLIDFLGRVIGRAQVSYAYPTPERAMGFARAAFADLQGALAPDRRRRVAGLGIGLPFHLWDWAKPLGVPAAAMTPWKHCDIGAELQAGLDMPVFLENDATAACGAELVFGADPLPADFIYYYVGYFVGGGVVLQDRLFTGPQGYAGALGSMPVPLGAGRTGQLIDIASLHPLDRSLCAAGHDSDFLWRGHEIWPIDAAILQRWLDGAANGLAHSIAGASAVLDTDLVIIDGWLPRELLNRLICRTGRALEAVDFSGLRNPRIRAGTVGADARALGAASLPLSQRFLMDAVGGATRPA
ncbi:MAG: ROK family transcriptional regulator [Pseudomonadota bacterium]